MIALLAGLVFATSGYEEIEVAIDRVVSAHAGEARRLTPGSVRRILGPRLLAIEPRLGYAGSIRSLDGTVLLLEWGIKPPKGSDDVRPALFGCAFWRRSGRVVGQVLERSEEGSDDDMPFFTPGGSDFYRFGQAIRNQNVLTWCGDADTGGNWSWPAVRRYELRGDRWRPITRNSLLKAQELSNGGTTFVRDRGSLNPDSVESIISEYPGHLDQPHSGPLLLAKVRWLLKGNHVVRERRTVIQTPLAKLDKIAALDQARDRKDFDADVPRRYRSIVWPLLSEPVFADVDAPYRTWSRDFYIGSGQRIVHLHFRRVSGGWSLSSVRVEPMDR